MLTFIDQPKHIRLVRTHDEGGVTSRAPIGRLVKGHLELSEDLRALLTPEKVSEVEMVIGSLKRAESVNRENYALSFPVIAREVMDRFEDGASESERLLITGALMEAVRRMRKFQRNQGLEG